MAAITSAAIGLGTAAYGIYNSEQQKKKAQRELNDYDRQVLDNAFENIQINTAGSDLIREQGAQTTANMVDALQNGGTRAIISGLPRVGAYANTVSMEAARNLDDQIARRDYAIAGDNARIEGITENRDNNNINALSSQIQAGKQGVWDGILGAGSSLAYGVRNLQNNNTPNPIVNSISGQATPMGMQPSPQQPITATPLPTQPQYQPFGTNYAPEVNPSPYFDFQNSYTPDPQVGGPQQYASPYFNFSNSYNGY